MPKMKFLTNKSAAIIIGVVLVAVVALLLLAPKKERAVYDEDEIRVLVSVLPQKGIVDFVGQRSVYITTLVKPGESHSTYTVDGSDLSDISSADIYFRIGNLPFEEEVIDKIRIYNPDIKIVELPENITLRYFEEDEDHGHEEDDQDHSDTEVDPHLWLSSSNVKILIESARDELSLLKPEKADYFADNAEHYLNGIDKYIGRLSDQLSKVENRNMLVFHPAWGYFADEFGFNQIAIEQDGNEPTAAGIKEIIDFAKSNKVNSILVQEQFSTAAAENIAAEIGVEVKQVDPLGENPIITILEVGDVLMGM